MKKTTKTVAATVNTNRRTANAEQRAQLDIAAAAAYAKRNGLDKPAPAAKRAALAAAAGFVKPAAAVVAENNARVKAAMKAAGVKVGAAVTKEQLAAVVKGAKAAKPTAEQRPSVTVVSRDVAAKAAKPSGPVNEVIDRVVAKQSAKRAAAEKPAAKPAGPVALVEVPCSKCGRANSRPEGSANGDCRVASACKARVRKATEPAKAVKTAKPTAKPAAAAASAPAAAPAVVKPRLVKPAKGAKLAPNGAAVIA